MSGRLGEAPLFPGSWADVSRAVSCFWSMAVLAKWHSVLESNCSSKDKNKLGLVLISTILYSKINTWSQVLEFFDFASQSQLLNVV